jgi:radical SAM superfamily enzyme YgiQ (UPF0313 family)
MDARAITPLDALFVGYEDQENLGLRWITAALNSGGWRAAVQQHTPGSASAVLSAIEARRPKLVGFSLIHQPLLEEFGALMRALREAGVTAHFTCGGHYPSLRPRETLEALPHLDSVVRFEGELTTLELMEHLEAPECWPAIRGLAFRQGAGVAITPPRPLIPDLDSLPLPVRSEPHLTGRGIRVAPMLASRGCMNDCSFCSIRRFYGGAPGPLRRVRSPEAVVGEMRELFDRDSVRFFVFHDDDFAARSRQQRQWLAEYLDALDRAGLGDQIGWRVACRVDDVDEDVIAACARRGLVFVFLGVESGSPAGLRSMNKHVTVEQNLQAIATLKKLDTAFEMGFMLLDPDSTVDSIQEDIDFLREVTADGRCPASFTKMLPYAGTPIEDRLAREGRLRGTAARPDYGYLDARLDWFGLFASRSFEFRNFDWFGLVKRLRLARFDRVLASRFEPGPGVDEYDRELTRLTALANRLALDTLQRALDFVKARDGLSIARDLPALDYLTRIEMEADAGLQRELDAILVRHSPQLLESFSVEYARRAANGDFDRAHSPIQTRPGG